MLDVPKIAALDGWTESTERETENTWSIWLEGGKGNLYNRVCFLFGVSMKNNK